MNSRRMIFRSGKVPWEEAIMIFLAILSVGLMLAHFAKISYADNLNVLLGFLWVSATLRLILWSKGKFREITLGSSTVAWIQLFVGRGVLPAIASFVIATCLSIYIHYTNKTVEEKK